MKECGECSLCCKLLDVPTLGKPKNVWCKYANKGCSVHAERPQVCRSFNCLWKESPVLGDDLRPDLCGIVFDVYPDEHTVVAVAEPDAEWAERKTKKLIDQMLSDGFTVWVVVGEERNLLLPAGQLEAQAVAQAKKAWEHRMT